MKAAEEINSRRGKEEGRELRSPSGRRLAATAVH